MPDGKNNFKLTGDTHLPDVGFEPIGEELVVETVVFVPEEQAGRPVYADGYVPGGQDARAEPSPGPARKAVAKMQRLEARAPWLAIGAGVAFGWLVVRMLRR